MIWLLLTTRALAWTFDPVELETSTVDAVTLGGDHVAWLTEGQAVVVDVTGVEVARIDTSATALALFDASRDGTATALLLCGAQGLEQHDLASGSSGVLSKDPCTAVVTTPGVAVSQHGTGLFAWSPSGAGVNPSPTAWGTGLPGADLAARFAGNTALAIAGSEQVQLVVDGDAVQTSPWSVGAPVRSLSTRQYTFFISTDDGLGLIDMYSEQGFVPYDETYTGPVAVADVDGDGRDDLVTVGADGLSVETTRWTVAFPSADFALLSGDPDGPPCSPVVGAGPDGAVLFVPVYCGGDADGDGVSSEDGDCDDGDADRGPHATELCNGIDDDCNEAIDDVGVTLSADAEADEGMPFSMTAVPSCEGGEMPQISIFAEGAGEAWCNPIYDGPDPHELPFECGAGDDGEVALIARTPDDRIAGRTTLTVHNLPPSLIVDGNNELIVYTSGSNAIGTNDIDEVTFTLLEGPRWMVLEPDGTIPVVAPRRGRWKARIRLDDGDGAVVEEDVVLVGRHPPISVTCRTGPSTGWLPLVFALIVLRRRS